MGEVIPWPEGPPKEKGPRLAAKDPLANSNNILPPLSRVAYLFRTPDENVRVREMVARLLEVA